MKQEKNALAPCSTFPDRYKKRAGESDEKGRKEHRSMWDFSFSLPLQSYHRSSPAKQWPHAGISPAWYPCVGRLRGRRAPLSPWGVPEELGPLWELLTRSVFQRWKHATSQRCPPPVAIWTVQPTRQGCPSALARECILQSMSTGSQFAFVIDGYAEDQILQRLRTRMWLYAANLIQPRQIPAGLVREREMENLWLQVTFRSAPVLTLMKWFCASQPSTCRAYL